MQKMEQITLAVEEVVVGHQEELVVQVDQELLL
jgi:hypothetical protein